MFGLFGKKDDKKGSQGSPGGLQINRDWTSEVKEIKKQRCIFCQNKGMSISEMGKDLAHIERKAKMFFNTAITALKEGKTADEVYRDLAANHVSSEIDKQILERLFVKK